jgi:hypothetical protein
VRLESIINDLEKFCRKFRERMTKQRVEAVRDDLTMAFDNIFQKSNILLMEQHLFKLFLTQLMEMKHRMTLKLRV